MVFDVKIKMEAPEVESTSSQEVAKRARVESLVSMMKDWSQRTDYQVINGCKKRKLYQPQQHESRIHSSAPSGGEVVSEEWKSKVSEMQLQLAAIQRKLMNFNSKVALSELSGEMFDNTVESGNVECISSADWKCLADSLKMGMARLIDDWVRQYRQEDMIRKCNSVGGRQENSNKTLQQILSAKPISCYEKPLKMQQPVFPSSGELLVHRPCSSPSPDAENMPMSLVVSPKKRRCKVTDKVRVPSRFSEEEEVAMPLSLATTVAVPNPSLLQTYEHLRSSPNSSPLKNDEYNCDVHSTTLTPLHLRKAKLMFFYVRYPSSSVLKDNFPDVKFNKNNTAQLVKWFSNFREFYYIQMEKYARQALSDGCQAASDITVSEDSEIYRVLTAHYNRNSHIKVPCNFRFVVEQTLKEFFLAISSGKNNEPSWKKVIYKVIARLDDDLPDFFKFSNFLEQLE